MVVLWWVQMRLVVEVNDFISVEDQNNGEKIKHLSFLLIQLVDFHQFYFLHPKISRILYKFKKEKFSIHLVSNTLQFSALHYSNIGKCFPGLFDEYLPNLGGKVLDHFAYRDHAERAYLITDSQLSAVKNASDLYCLYVDRHSIEVDNGWEQELNSWLSVAHKLILNPTFLESSLLSSSTPPISSLPQSSPSSSPPEVPPTIQGTNNVKIAAIQMCSVDDKSENLSTTFRLVAQAADAGAHFICLPECSVFMSSPSNPLVGASEVIDLKPYISDSSSSPSGTGCSSFVSCSSPYIASLCALARMYRVWLSIGGFPEARPDLGLFPLRVSNTHFVIDPQGMIRGDPYRKIHLFDSPLTGLMESKNTAPGDKVVVVDAGFARLGLSICYDIRFPQLYSALCDPHPPSSPSSSHSDDREMVDTGGHEEEIERGSYTGGADIVLVPAAFTVPTGRAHWELLLRTRAVENQVYVVAAAQCGVHRGGRESYGHSMIIDPWGTIVSCLPEGEGVIYAEYDPSVVSSIRSKMPIQSHRRHDIYRNYRR